MNKPIFLTIAMAWSCLTSFGQIQPNTPVDGLIKIQSPQGTVQVMNPRPVKPSANQSAIQTASFAIDYDMSDSIAQTELGNAYSDLLTPYEYNLNRAATDTGMVAFGVAFDSIYDYTTRTGYPKEAVQKLVLDSLFVLLGQENNGNANNDTLIIWITGITDGYLDTNIYAKDTAVYSTVNPLDTTWRNLYYLKFTFGTDTVNPTFEISPSLHDNKNFGVIVIYKGGGADTCVFVSRYAYSGTCTVGANTIDKPVKSLFSPAAFWPDYTNNSFFFLNANLGSYPREQNGNLLPGYYYNCDGAAGYTYGSDGEYQMQNIIVIPYVTVVHSLNIAEAAGNKLVLHPAVPNPFTSRTTIKYSLDNAATVSFELSDMLGRTVMLFNEGFKASGNHEISIDDPNLKPGVYFYTLRAGEVSSTKKFIVSE